jgi:hypothetical protein
MKLTPEDRMRRAVALLTGVRNELMGREGVPEAAKVIATKAGFLRHQLQTILGALGEAETLDPETYTVGGDNDANA